jgi:hypothetical protein
MIRKRGKKMLKVANWRSEIWSDKLHTIQITGHNLLATVLSITRTEPIASTKIEKGGNIKFKST